MSKSQADPSFVLNFFKEQLTSDNVYHRLFSARSLPLVAAAMGPEHARTALIDYLKTTDTLDGEVQMNLAAQLGNLVKYVGGSEYASTLIEPIKVFASADEIIVRDKAIESMAMVVDALPPDDADNLMDDILELASAPHFTARSSSCAFIVLIYPSVSEANRTSLRNIFKKLVKDETPMVRRAALKQLPAFCDLLPASILIQEFAKDVLVNSVEDDEDSVRLLLPASVAVISGKLEDAERSQLIIYLCKSIVKDPSWRVRQALAEAIPDITAPFSPDVVISDLAPLVFRLLRDPEAETKAAACNALSKILPFMRDQQAFVDEKVYPEIQQLTRDLSNIVRRAACLHFWDLAPIIGTASTNEKMVPTSCQVLQENDNEASVALLTSLFEHVEEIDFASMTPLLLPVILEKAPETHWRVKVCLIKLLGPFAKVLGLDGFSAKFFPIVKLWLIDQNSYSVKEKMAEHLGELITILGMDWGTSTLATHLLTLKEDKSFFIRQIFLLSVQKLSNVMNPQILAKTFLKNVLELENDKVPNIRMMVGRTLALFTSLGDPKVEAALKHLASDSDPDVSDVAKAATNSKK